MTEARDENRIQITAAKPEGWTISEIATRIIVVPLVVIAVTVVTSLALSISAPTPQAELALMSRSVSEPTSQLESASFFKTVSVPERTLRTASGSQCTTTECDHTDCSKSDRCVDQNTGDDFPCYKLRTVCAVCNCD